MKVNGCSYILNNSGVNKFVYGLVTGQVILSRKDYEYCCKELHFFTVEN